MMEYCFQKTQFELKSLTQIHQKELFKIDLNLNLLKISQLSDVVVLDGFYLLEFFSSNKPFFNKYKKSYKQVSLQLMNNVRKQSKSHFLNILKLFYFPALYRRSERFNYNQISQNNFSFTISNINLLPFIPDIYFKWMVPLNCNLNFKYLKSSILFIYLQFLGYVFRAK